MAEVDIIIPTRNRVDLTLRAVQSVLDQSFTEIAIYVVDDASEPDCYEALATRLAGLPRVSLIRSQGQQGPALSRQLAFDSGSADWVATLDSDDEWLPTKLERQLALASHTGADLVLCWFAWIRPDGTTRVTRKPAGSGAVSPALTNNMDVPLARRSLVESVGGFRGDEASPLWCDEHIDFMVRVLSAAHTQVVPEVLALCHEHSAVRASDDVTVTVDSLRQILTHRSEAFRRFPNDLAALRANLAARELSLGRKRVGLAEFRRALQTATPVHRLALLTRYSPFVVKRILTPQRRHRPRE